MTDRPDHRVGGSTGPARRPRGRPGAGGRPGPTTRPAGGRGPADPARRAAYDLLRAVAERGAYANLTLPGLLRERGLTGRDAAFATELGYGTLRAQGTLDAVLSRCADRPLAEVDGAVLDLLRLGAYQALRTRVPAHAAVSATVDLAPRRAAGFVNAVLRRVARQDWDGWVVALAPPEATDPVGHLALQYAHPAWVVAAFADALGGDLAETARALAADDARPQVHLVARPGRIDRDALVAASGGEPGPWSRYAVRLPGGGDPGAVEAVADGWAGVQDEGSQLCALAVAEAPVGPRPQAHSPNAGSPDARGPDAGSPDARRLDGGSRHSGSPGAADPSAGGADARWLELCAGPGGKSALLGALAVPRRARLLAVERQPARARLVAAATAGLPVTVLQADGRVPAWPAGAFDRVLVDAPCTGLGALRRRPEARWRRQPSDLPELTRLQRALLAAGLAATRPGGLLGYVVCSPHPAETRAVVAEVVRQAGESVEQLDARPYFPGVPGLGDGPYVQLWPHRHGTDAMFCALLRRGDGGGRG